VGYAEQPAKMTPSLSMPEALTLWLEKYGEMCFVSKRFGVGGLSGRPLNYKFQSDNTHE
jgi:hypothetical protein